MAKRIMIIDDEQDVRLYLKTLFEKNGYETETARDGDEGYPKTAAFKPDLITLDILMPKQSGIRLYTQLKEDEALKEVPVVVLTGLTQYQQFYQQDFPEDELPDAFVEKPIQQDALLKIVQGLIGEADAQGD
ncbi:MAG: response regulator [Thermodesulfobacteriota bacterium]